MSTTSTPTLPAVSATSRVRRPRLLRRLTAVMAGTAAAILGVGILPANATGYPFGTPSGSVGDLLSHGRTTCPGSLLPTATLWTPAAQVSEVGGGWQTRYQIVYATTTVQAWWGGAWHDYTTSTERGDDITGYLPGSPYPLHTDQTFANFSGQELQLPALRGYWVRIATTFTWYAASSQGSAIPYPAYELGHRSYFYSADSYFANKTTNLNPGGACVLGA